MAEQGGRILVFAKAPIPGLVKSRLIPALGAEGAADLHRALTRQTLETAAQAGAAVELWCYPDTTHPFFQDCAQRFALTLHVQQGDGLGRRMLHAARHSLDHGAYPILIGTDCPSLTASDLREALAALAQGADAVLGPAADGGYYLLGLKQAARTLFTDMPWGTAQVLAETRQRLQHLAWHWHELPTKRDIDEPDDLRFLPPSLAQTITDGSEHR